MLKASERRCYGCCLQAASMNHAASRSSHLLDCSSLHTPPPICQGAAVDWRLHAFLTGFCDGAQAAAPAASVRTRSTAAKVGSRGGGGASGRGGDDEGARGSGGSGAAAGAPGEAGSSANPQLALY